MQTFSWKIKKVFLHFRQLPHPKQFYQMIDYFVEHLPMFASVTHLTRRNETDWQHFPPAVDVSKATGREHFGLQIHGKF